MAIKIPYLAIGTTILTALGAASCHSRDPNAVPSPITPSPIVPAPVLVRVELIAPASIAPGESVQLTANAVRSDNSVENVTGQAQWRSSNSSVLEISSTGIAKAISAGDVFINVSYQSRGASAHTFVLPTGTYRLTGKVTDAGFGLAGVTITVIGGVGEGLTTTTDGNGMYALYGVRDRIRLHTRAVGYANRIEEIDVPDHRTFNFEMFAERQRTDLRGSYAISFAATSCPDPFPQIRSYDAILDQDGPRLTVMLSGADFIVTRGRGNGFSGFIDGADRITFRIGDASFYYYYYGQYDLVERISDTSALIISGGVMAGLSSRGISGTFNGDFLLVQGTAAPFNRIQARCHGTAHRFEMVRR